MILRTRFLGEASNSTSCVKYSRKNTRVIIAEKTTSSTVAGEGAVLAHQNSIPVKLKMPSATPNISPGIRLPFRFCVFNAHDIAERNPVLTPCSAVCRLFRQSCAAAGQKKAKNAYPYNY